MNVRIVGLAMGELVIVPGSKVTIKHRDGSVLVTHVRGDGMFESGHVKPFDRAWIDTYGWHIVEVEPPVDREVKRLAELIEATDYDWSDKGKDPYIARAEYIVGQLRGSARVDD